MTYVSSIHLIKFSLLLHLPPKITIIYQPPTQLVLLLLYNTSPLLRNPCFFFFLLPPLFSAPHIPDHISYVQIVSSHVKSESELTSQIEDLKKRVERDKEVRCLFVLDTTSHLPPPP